MTLKSNQNNELFTIVQNLSFEQEENSFNTKYSDNYNYFIKENIQLKFLREVLLTDKNMYNDYNMSDNDQIINNLNSQINLCNQKRQKRGKKAKMPNKRKEHIGSDFDNIQKMIQSHFFNYIINISNDAIRTICNSPKKKFKKIDYNIKKKVNAQFFQLLKSYSLRDILEMDISSKYTKFSKEHNKTILNSINNIWLDKFFNMNYLELFEFYYNKGKPGNKISFKGKDIIFSRKTKNFYNLIEKNKNYKNHLINTVRTAYFNGNLPFTGNNLFVILKHKSKFDLLE